MAGVYNIRYQPKKDYGSLNYSKNLPKLSYNVENDSEIRKMELELPK